jgi:hypothetical protein
MTNKGWSERLTDKMAEKHKKGEVFTDTDWITFYGIEIAHARAEEAERCMEREKKAREEERARVLHSLGLWWINDGVGVSSKAIFMYMTQNVVPRPFAAPYDEADRKRCVMLLRAVPEWIDRLSEIEEYKIEGTSNGKKVMPWNEQIPLIREALTPPTNHCPKCECLCADCSVGAETHCLSDGCECHE